MAQTYFRSFAIMKLGFESPNKYNTEYLVVNEIVVYINVNSLILNILLFQITLNVVTKNEYPNHKYRLDFICVHIE